MKKRWIIAISFLLAAAGFLWPFWPLSVLGILLSAFTDHFIVAVLLGLLLDVAYGAPFGMLHFLYVPFTILAVAAVLLRSVSLTYLRRDS